MRVSFGKKTTTADANFVMVSDLLPQHRCCRTHRSILTAFIQATAAGRPKLIRFHILLLIHLQTQIYFFGGCAAHLQQEESDGPLGPRVLFSVKGPHGLTALTLSAPQRQGSHTHSRTWTGNEGLIGPKDCRGRPVAAERRIPGGI